MSSWPFWYHIQGRKIYTNHQYVLCNKHVNHFILWILFMKSVHTCSIFGKLINMYSSLILCEQDPPKHTHMRTHTLPSSHKSSVHFTWAAKAKGSLDKSPSVYILWPFTWASQSDIYGEICTAMVCTEPMGHGGTIKVKVTDCVWPLYTVLKWKGPFSQSVKQCVLDSRWFYTFINPVIFICECVCVCLCLNCS